MHASGEHLDAELDAFRSRVRNRLAEHGRRVGVAYAEAFKLMDSL